MPPPSPPRTSTIRPPTRSGKQAIGKRVFKQTGKIVPSRLGIEIEQALVDPTLIAAIDLGVDQLAAITSNKPGFQPRLYNGRPLKDLNHYSNQQRTHHQKQLAKQNRNTSRKLDRITTKRHRRVKAYLHTASRRIIDLLVSEGMGTFVQIPRRLNG
jgi:putative transposase